MVTDHPWMLVAPWYRWTTPPAPVTASAGRASAPVFQKFASGNFANEFLKQPQHSLKFDPIVDQAYDVHSVPASLAGVLSAKHATLYPWNENGENKASRVTLVPALPSGLRKLFLDTHNRHYLVVCELHCDMPGFPNASNQEVCQAGFVVRRRYVDYPDSAAPAAKVLLREIVAIQSRLAELEETAPLRPRAAKRRAEKNQQLKKAGKFDAARGAVVTELTAARARLDQWKNANGVRSILQGWVAAAHEKIGEWQVEEDEPAELTEGSFPLYPLFADPAIPDHDAKGRTIYFGVVPTSSMDADAKGRARFDDRSTYEIRCFVRRHKPGCPRTLPPPDCCGQLTWSRPTERYRLASQFDLEGTSNRPITIQMPNLAELAAQAVHLPFGKYSPVKFVQPQGLQPAVAGKAVSGGNMKGFQICFFSIPLITIIALFVLNIFLPIVVLIFNLWFLLAFKFCILPGISVAGKLQAELNAVPPSVNVDTDAALSVDVNRDGTAEVGPAAVQAELALQVGADIAADTGMDRNQVQGGLSGFANSPLIALNKNNAELQKLNQDPRSDPPIVDYTAGLEFEERRTLQVVA